MYEEDKKDISPLSPELYNKDPERAEYIKMGFCSKEDYECYQRRMGDRKKGA